MTEEKKRIRKRQRRRKEHGNDKERIKVRGWQYYFFFCHPRTSAARSGDLWIFGSYAQRDATVGCPGQGRTWQERIKAREWQAVASLTATSAAARNFVEARCFLRAYREPVPCVRGCPAQGRTWQERIKTRQWRKENKSGNDNILFLCFTFNIVAFLYDKNRCGSIIGRQKNLYFH